MKYILIVTLIIGSFINVQAQSDEARKIYQTEKDFERAVAEKGFNEGFTEYMAPDGIIFRPNAVNAREFFKSQPKSAALLTWNPIFIDVSANGALGYSLGNGMFRPKGKDDANIYYSHYVSIWQRQPDGSYKAVLDAGITHEKPEKTETEWKSPADSGKELNEKKISAADSSIAFFEAAEKQDLQKAYKMFLADDARLLREGKMPFVGKKEALSALKNDKSKIKFVKRSVFTSAADMAYLTNGYTLFDKNGKETEKGNFVQVWKLRDGKWQIVLDIFTPAK